MNKSEIVETLMVMREAFDTSAKDMQAVRDGIAVHAPEEALDVVPTIRFFAAELQLLADAIEASCARAPAARR